MSTIRRVTSLPGPRSRQVLERIGRSVARSVAPGLPIVAAHAHGSLVTDLDGNQFIDLTGGVGVLNVGHTPQVVVAAIADQAARLVHTDFSVLPHEPYVDFVEALLPRVPITGEKRAALFNSGAEAVENAVKIARRATGRSAVIAFEGGFHGRTLLTMSLTSRVRPYKFGFGPFAPEVYRVPFPYPYRCPFHGPTGDCGAACFHQIERAFVSVVDPREVAAVIVEPVLGEGGFVVPPDGFLPYLREITRRHGQLMILDEIQTGFCRTGHWFAAEHFGVEPDLMTLAKSVAAGMPLSAVVGPRRIMDAPEPGALGGTFIGNPVACAAATAAMGLMARERLWERARHIGATIRSTFEPLLDAPGLLGEVRGVGAMVALELVTDRATREPAAEATERLVVAARERGVLLLRAGLYGNCIRFLTSLRIEDEVLAEALAVVRDLLSTLA